MKHVDIPDFGMLAGLRVVCVGPSVAGPYAASMMADNGADVIFVENPNAPELLRFMCDGAIFERERKNGRDLVLNLAKPEGQEVLFKLAKQTDILIDTSKGGQWAGWGLTDEKLWAANPALVIAHVSGYGQTGAEKYVKRACYDGVGQAFGGYLSLNGPAAPEAPGIANPSTADYMTAMFTYASCLAAHYRALKTGEGESLDIAQYEVMVKALQPFDTFHNGGIPWGRHGNKNALACQRCYTCKDGRWLYMLACNHRVIANVAQLLGFDPADERFANKVTVMMHEPGGKELDDAMEKWCLEHDAAEAEEILNSLNVACSLVLTVEDMWDHPHYQARETLISWTRDNGKEQRSVNAMPKVKNRPGKVFRAAPKFGQDNDDIFEEIGLSADEVKALYEARITAKDPSLA